MGSQSQNGGQQTMGAQRRPHYPAYGLKPHCGFGLE